MTKPKKSSTAGTKEIETGEVRDAKGNPVAYRVVHGWDAKASIACDIDWKTGWMKLFEEIDQVEDETKQKEILASIPQEDFHWKWFDKAMYYSGPEYEWFHLYAQGKPQAACLIYHPKPSVLEKGDIFYVEYVAVAPWNRPCSLRPRELRGVGKAIIRAALRYAVNTLKLRPGFGLNSLPQATGFYDSLKMVSVKGHEKDDMLYFELPGALAAKLMEAS